jgi:hypothetical protein
MFSHKQVIDDGPVYLMGDNYLKFVLKWAFSNYSTFSNIYNYYQTWKGIMAIVLLFPLKYKN